MPRPREFDENLTLAAIRNTFWDRGYVATSVDDLVEATGLGKGSLYGAFGSKREMFVRALRDYCDGGLAYAEQWVGENDGGAQRRLRSYVYETVRLIANSKRGCLLAKAIAELAGQDDDVDRIVGNFYRRYEDLFARVIARRHARLLVAALRGLESMGKAGVPEATLRGIAESALNVARDRAV